MTDRPARVASAVWDELISDRDATAAELEADGWDVQSLTVGDVTALPANGGGERGFVGLSVLVSGDEFRTLEASIDDEAVDSYEAYGAVRDGVMLLVLVLKASEDKRAVCLPAYYGIHEADAMIDAAREAGHMSTAIRPLSGDRRVVFTHHEIGPLLPDQ